MDADERGFPVVLPALGCCNELPDNARNDTSKGAAQARP